MWIVAVRSLVRVQDVPRHPEVDQEHAPAFEPKNQILPATIDALDALSLELGRHLGWIVGTREPRVGDVDALEPATGEVRLEPTTNRLDFGQLRHAPSVAARRPGPASVQD